MTGAERISGNLTVGFVGLGSQGLPMAEMILRAGWPLTVYARRDATLEPFHNTAATIASSIAELGADAELVCVCVVDDDQVEHVVVTEGLLDAMGPGSILAIHSTVDPERCKKLGELAAARRIAVLDAPVSGNTAAYDRKLAVMVGGALDAFTRAEPVFASYGDPIVHMGPLGSGQLTKLVNNVLFTANLRTASLAVELGTLLGVNGENLVRVLSGGSAQSFALGVLALMESAHDGTSGAVRLLRKDVDLLRAAAGGETCADDLVALAEAMLSRLGSAP